MAKIEMLYSIKQKQKSEKEKLYYEKKLFTIALSLIMVIAMAVPAYAGTIKNGNYFMNLYGSEGASLQGREVSLYSSGSSKGQQFALYLYNNQYVIINAQNFNFALNRESAINILAEFEDTYLTISDYTKKMIDVGDSVVETYYPQYAFISKQDFSKSIDNYSLVEFMNY